MHKPEKSPEPSMEEILASIRKIIAEEPIGTRSGPVPRAPSPDSARPIAGLGKPADERAAPIGLPAGTPAAAEKKEPRFGLDDALADLIDETPSRVEPTLPQGGRDVALGGEPSGDADHRPSWLFARSAVPAPPQAVNAPSAGRAATGVPSSLDVLRQATRQGGPAEVRHPAAAAEPAADTRRVDPEPPSAAGMPRQSVEGVPIGPKPPAGAGLPAKSLPPDSQTPATPAAPQPRAGSASALPAVDAARPQVDVAAEAAAPVPGAARPATAEPVRQPSPQAGTTGASLAAFAPGLAHGDVPAPATGPSFAETASVPVTGAVRTLEDTISDLLRPLLREWLDQNMPRIVEKALRVELAASARSQTQDRSQPG